jgi:hypothetical protein
LDLETLRPPEVVGWSNHGAMGVSVLCICDVLSDVQHFEKSGILRPDSFKKIWTYTEPIISHRDEIIEHLETADVIVTHNGHAFDLRVLELAINHDCRKYTPKVIDFANTIYFKHGVRISLENLVRAQFGRKFTIKFLSGDKVCEYWASGDPVKRQQVIEHCQLDVLWTALVFLSMLENTVYKKGVPVGGKVFFYNWDEAQKRKRGQKPSRRIMGTCIIPYPAVLRTWMSPKKSVKKNAQYTFNRIIHKLIQPSSPPKYPLVPVKQVKDSNEENLTD